MTTHFATDPSAAILSKVIMLLTVVLTLLLNATGQGIQPFSTIDAGPDVVDVASLSFSYQIPVFSRSGRALPFSYNLPINNAGWTPVYNPGLGKSVWQPSTFDSTFGVAEATGVVSFSTSAAECVVTGTHTLAINEYSNFSYAEPNGTSHSYKLTLYSSGCPKGHPTSGSATDTTGSTLTFAVRGSPATYTASITLPDGRVVVPPVNGVACCGYAAGNGPAYTATDSNGNQIIVNGQGDTNNLVSVVDTQGTTVLSSSGTAPSPVSFTYTSPSGTAASVTMSYKAYNVQTDVGCSTVNEFGPESFSLLDRVTLPDSSYYQFGYEPTTPGSANVTGRIAFVRLPTGGTISYAYTGGDTNKGWFCASGQTAGLVRTTPDGTWKYTLSGSQYGSATNTTTTVTDPLNNQTVYTFDGEYITQRQVYAGSASGTPLANEVTCYNGTAFANCPTSRVVGPAIPITEITKYLQQNGGPFSKVDNTYNAYSLVTEKDEYDFGATSPSRKTAIAYDSTLGNGIVDHPSSVKVTDGSGNFQAETDYVYDEDVSNLQSSGASGLIALTCTAQSGKCRGNLTTKKEYVTPSATMASTFTHYDTGQVYVATDVNGATTTSTYGDCNHSFVTNTSLPLGLSTSNTWNCVGGVMTSATDENHQVSYFNYTLDKYFWRPESRTDPASNTTNYTYQSFIQSESSLVFGASTVDTLTSLDGMGRAQYVQHKQAPGSSNYDSVQNAFDALGRPYTTSVPYVGTAGQAAPGGTKVMQTLYDASGRAQQITDGGGGVRSYTYNQNDVLQINGPPPAGENAKERQLEYDGLGRVTSVCEILSTGGTSCGQTNPASGYKTSYVYSVLTTGGAETVVTQGAQTRTYLHDGLGRVVSETTPESGTTTYIYDSYPAGACGLTSAPGDLMLKINNDGNSVCYAHDPSHRLTDTGTSAATGKVCKRFRYDTVSNAVQPKPSGSTIINGTGRLIESETDNCSVTPPTAATMITDEWYSYDVDGRVTDTYESTLHSGGYYHTTVGSYYANGEPTSLGGIPGINTITFGLEGEGRLSRATFGTTSLVSSVTYNAASQPQSVANMAGDTDSYTYDPNTGRMTQYAFTVATHSETGALAWNSNGSLRQLAITDGFNSGGSQTCNFGTSSVMGYDDIGRLLSADCSPVWSQSFSYDQYGNITKAGSLAFQPTYTATTNQMFSLPGAPVCNSTTKASVCYDANGNLVNDSYNVYSWDSYGDMASVISAPNPPAVCGTSGTCVTYDALDREVELNSSGSYTQLVYGPLGRVATMNGQTAVAAFSALPGGATLVTSASGWPYYEHSDWLGTARLESQFNATLGNGPDAVSYDRAFAPFGEVYAQFGTSQRLQFTGDLQAIGSSGLFDTPNRELQPNQGRWISPDPSGLTAVNPSNPQTWNAYSYALNVPTLLTDVTGLDPNGGRAGGKDFHLRGCAAACWGFAPGTNIEFCTLDGLDTPCGILGVLARGQGLIALPAGCDAVSPCVVDGVLINLHYKPDGRVGGCTGGSGFFFFCLVLAPLPGSLVSGADNSFSFTLGIRAPDQTYSQCLAANSSTYSLHNWLPSSWQNGATKFALGNDVSGALFGDANEGTAGLLVGAGIGAAPLGVGTAGTFGRRTASIFNLNLSGKTGPAPTILGKTGAEEVVGWVSGAFELKLAADVGATAAEALNCIRHR